MHWVGEGAAGIQTADAEKAAAPTHAANSGGSRLRITGGTSDMLHATGLANFNAINNVPMWFGSQNSGHMGTWDQINAGEMGKAATAWIRWKFFGDAESEKMFVGPDCTLCKPPSEWVMIMKKMID